MSISTLNLSESTTNALLQLALKVELFENHRFSVTKSIDQLASLIQMAGRSKNKQVQQKLKQCVTKISPDILQTLQMRSVVAN